MTGSIDWYSLIAQSCPYWSSIPAYDIYIDVTSWATKLLTGHDVNLIELLMFQNIQRSTKEMKKNNARLVAQWHVVETYMGQQLFNRQGGVDFLWLAVCILMRCIWKLTDRKRTSRRQSNDRRLYEMGLNVTIYAICVFASLVKVRSTL